MNRPDFLDEIVDWLKRNEERIDKAVQTSGLALLHGTAREMNLTTFAALQREHGERLRMQHEATNIRRGVEHMIGEYRKRALARPFVEHYRDACNRAAESRGFLPCKRDRGHDGPCAHEFCPGPETP